MSRRSGFDTSLSGPKSKPQPKSNAPGSTSTSSASRSSTSTSASIVPPKSDTPVVHVPKGTETRAEEAAEEAQEGVAAADDMEEEEEGQGQCFICAEPIEFWSVGVCGHRTCHVCALRLRVFYKKFECTFCKTSQPSLLFSRSPATPFPTENHIKPSPANVIAAAQANADKLEKGQKWDQGLTLPGLLDYKQFQFSDAKTGVVFEDEDMMDATLLLLRFNCPYTDCPHQAESWDKLQKHTLSEHRLTLCMICCRQLSRFAHEHVLYPPHLLPLHDPSRLARGQRPPRVNRNEAELIKGWDAPHPMCEFCHEAFFSADELFHHMRNKHEECFVCRQQGEKDVYFRNYQELENHFNREHFPCQQPACLEQKFVVFGSELDLRAHMITEHKGQISNRELNAARQIQVDFQADHSAPSSSSRQNGSSRQQNGQGRGFKLQNQDQNPSIPDRSAQPFRREAPPHAQHIAPPAPMAPEQAAQHRRQVNSDRQEENRRRRAFNTQLTDSARHTEEEGPSGSGYATPAEDVDEALAARHANLLSRVALMVSDSEMKLTSFRFAIRAFKQNESTAKDMIDTIFNVLDREDQATVSVVKEIGGIFEAEGEKDQAKQIWIGINAFRAEQEAKFPALSAGPASGAQYAGVTSGQILRAKNTTHTSGRGGSSSHVWERVAAAASSTATSAPRVQIANQRFVPGSGMASTSAFPSLAMGAGSTNGTGARATSSIPHSTPWAGGGAGSSSKSLTVLAGPIVRSTNPNSNSNSNPSANANGNTVNHNFPVKAKSAKPPSQAAFPSLPAPSKTSSTVDRKALFNKPTPREESIRKITGQAPVPPPSSARGWGGPPPPVGTGITEGMENVSLDEAPGAGAGKKKGKGKQLLFSVSARP